MGSKFNLHFPYKKDRWIWSGNKNGLHSVNMIMPVLGESSHDPLVDRICKKVWKLKVLVNIQLFCWKIISSALPTCALLMKRKFKGDLSCVQCGQSLQSHFQLFFTWRWLSQLWFASPLVINIISHLNRSFFLPVDRPIFYWHIQEW